MPDNYPYAGATAALVQILDHLRKSFPANLDSETLKKLGFAPGNESRILNIVRFIKLIDDQGARTASAQKIFTLHDPESFEKSFSELLKAAYSQLFELHGDAAWSIDKSKLITFFRQTDQSSELVGTRQANTFRTLAAYAGHGDPVPTAKSKAKTGSNGKPKPSKPQLSPKPAAPREDSPLRQGVTLSDRNLGLTVRIEINLPSTGDQDTYDNIFKSIRKNLLNG